MPFFSVHDQKFHAEDSGGDGPAVVFSHGNLMDHTMWEPQVSALRGGYRCVAWDERLHGRTVDDGRPHTYWQSADDLLGLLDAMDIGRAVLVGHSQGGFLSLRAALRAPERVAGLVLVDTRATAWPERDLARMGAVADAFEAAGPDAVGPQLLDLLIGEPALHEVWLAKWRAQPPHRSATAVRTLMGVDDISARLSGITVPALVVHGEWDAPVPVAAGRALHAALPGAQDFVLVPGAAHTPNLTHAAEVTRALAGFLGRL
ncbi:alpha/beta fold hydrolase [Streptomyces sp. NPDC001606]